MTDFPNRFMPPYNVGVLSTVGDGSPINDLLIAAGQSANNATAWPAVNQAIYVPVVVPAPIKIFQMGLWVVVTATGNVDVGIYDNVGNKIVSSGSTAIGASATIQVFNITDTVLNPGTYFLASWCSTITTATFQNVLANATCARAGGYQIQSSLASGLPTTATFANPAGGYTPVVVATYAANGTF